MKMQRLPHIQSFCHDGLSAHTDTHWDWQHCIVTILIVHHKKIDNKHAKSSCAPRNWYKNYIVSLDFHVHCQPQKYYRFMCGQKVSVLACFLWPIKKWKMLGVTPISDRHRPPCAPWCTMQLIGAQRWSVVHNVFLYWSGGAQHRSHKPRQTHRHRNTAPILWPRQLTQEVKRMR